MGYVEATEEGKLRAVNAVQGRPAKVIKMKRRGKMMFAEYQQAVDVAHYENPSGVGVKAP